MLKKIIIILLCIISNNSFCETPDTEKKQHYIDPKITAKQLELFERQGKYLAERGENLYSTERKFITGVALSTICGAIGGMTFSIASENKQPYYNPDGAIVMYALTCIVITGFVVAKEIRLSDNLKSEQISLTSAIKNLQESSSTGNNRPSYTVSDGSTFIRADGGSSIRF